MRNRQDGQRPAGPARCNALRRRSGRNRKFETLKQIAVVVRAGRLVRVPDDGGFGREERAAARFGCPAGGARVAASCNC